MEDLFERDLWTQADEDYFREKCCKVRLERDFNDIPENAEKFF